MNRVQIVTLERAGWTAKSYLLRAEQCLQQPQEKRHPEDHYEHGNEPTQRPFERDVAEARGR